MPSRVFYRPVLWIVSLPNEVSICQVVKKPIRTNNICHCDKLRDAATFKGKSSKSQVILYFLQQGSLDSPVAPSNLKMKVVFVHSFVDPL